MRNMSFAMTTPQILARTKTVTRRMGWEFAKVGDVVQPIEKGQGLKKGETVTKIGGPIRFTAVDRVVLEDITPQDVFREGFPSWPVPKFIKFFKRANHCNRRDRVTRIAFEYLDSDVRQPADVNARELVGDHQAGHPAVVDLHVDPNANAQGGLVASSPSSDRVGLGIHANGSDDSAAVHAPQDSEDRR